jgi:hypothetical protein
MGCRSSKQKESGTKPISDFSQCNQQHEASLQAWKQDSSSAWLQHLIALVKLEGITLICPKAIGGASTGFFCVFSHEGLMGKGISLNCPKAILSFSSIFLRFSLPFSAPKCLQASRQIPDPCPKWHRICNLAQNQKSSDFDQITVGTGMPAPTQKSPCSNLPRGRLIQSPAAATLQLTSSKSLG